MNTQIETLTSLDKYNYPTVIEPTNAVENEYKVVGQDGSLPFTLHTGTYDECVIWRNQNCTHQAIL